MDYFIGDTHFGGTNIILNSHREFKSSKEMDRTIINNWNNTVKFDDTVFIVGDFFDNTNLDFMKEIINMLRGNKILIKGNHDEGFCKVYRSLGIEVIEYPIVYNDFFIISHKPLYISAKGAHSNIFAHVHDNPMYKTVSPRSFCVSAERINYTPISFNEIVEKMKSSQD